jgi:hypothetical protein
MSLDFTEVCADTRIGASFLNGNYDEGVCVTVDVASEAGGERI